MRKWKALLKSIVLSFLLYMWFLGSSLLIKIDTQQVREAREKASLVQQFAIQKKWASKVENLVKNVYSYCSVEQVQNNIKSQSERKTANETYLRAKREKGIRDSLIYIPELNQLWCLVPKAASTSWSRKIVDNIPSLSLEIRRDLKNESIPVQVVLRKHFGNIGTKKYKEILQSKNIQRILLVRHPFTRIVSAFEDKLKNRKARSDSMYFYGHYGVKINRSFRKNRKYNKRKEPTFEEFVDYLVETNPENYDEHWKPISLLCGLCLIDYNHIIKQEDLENDIAFHLEKLGFDESRRIKLRRDNKSVKEFEHTFDYFKNMSLEKKMKLSQKYKDDLKFFQYESIHDVT